jgi:hypothetical protein
LLSSLAWTYTSCLQCSLQKDLEEEVVIGESGELAVTFFVPTTIDCYVAVVVELWRAWVSALFPANCSNRRLVLVLEEPRLWSNIYETVHITFKISLHNVRPWVARHTLSRDKIQVL